jgi:hypothetical protein
MSLALSALRQRVAAAIISELGGSGWIEAAVPFDRFPGQEEGVVLGDRAFAVGVPNTVALGEPQRRATSVEANTGVAVRYVRPLAAMDMVASYDEALDEEATIIAAVQTVARSAGLNMKFEAAERSVVEDGVLVGLVTWRACHQFSLAG